jgi:hypothetical protein
MIKFYFNILLYGILLGSIGAICAQKPVCLSGDCINGFGHSRWKGGEEYLGNFWQGKMNGYGVFYWHNKRKYVGYWKNGKIEGKGTLFNAEGILKKGWWSNNKLVKLERKEAGLTEQNLVHGYTQLKTITKDRPLMLSIVHASDENVIWNWVQRKLAGEDIGSRIFWQDTASYSFPIPTGVKAVHAYPTATTEGRVWLQNTKHPEQMWSSLIFELHNIRNGTAFQEIEKAAVNFNCDKKTYILSYARLEYQAAKETKQFYQKIWLPYCKKKGLKTEPIHWFYYLPDTFEEWMASFKDKKGYPWHPYAGYYNKIVSRVIADY